MNINCKQLSGVLSAESLSLAINPAVGSVIHVPLTLINITNARKMQHTYIHFVGDNNSGIQFISGLCEMMAKTNNSKMGF